VCVDALRHERIAVGSAIGMPEAERAIALEVDEQLAPMGGSMMSRAQGREIGRLVATAFGTRLDMVHVDEGRVGAARHGASMSIAGEHGAPPRRRDALSGAARTDVGAGGSLRVAALSRRLSVPTWAWSLRRHQILACWAGHAGALRACDGLAVEGPAQGMTPRRAEPRSPPLRYHLIGDARSRA
jgi:hypothetical protein